MRVRRFEKSYRGHFCLPFSDPQIRMIDFGVGEFKYSTYRSCRVGEVKDDHSVLGRETSHRYDPTTSPTELQKLR